MLQILSSLFGIFGSFFKGLFSTEQAKIQADAQVETASIQGMAQVETKWWFVSACIVGYALIFLSYDAKVVVWDNLLSPYFYGHTGFTPALKGSVDWVHRIVITGLFLHAVAK